MEGERNAEEGGGDRWGGTRTEGTHARERKKLKHDALMDTPLYTSYFVLVLYMHFLCFAVCFLIFAPLHPPPSPPFPAPASRARPFLLICSTRAQGTVIWENGGEIKME